MKRRLLFGGCSLLLATLLWSVVAWPLPLHVFQGIPAAPLNPERAAPQRMIPGDHLQLVYQSWLANDTLFGPTSWGDNPYEFNPGGENAQPVSRPFSFPFHLIFGLGSLLRLEALGWNLTFWVALAVSLGATVLWLKRWSGHRPILIWSAALLGHCLPIYWHNVLKGSPAALAQMWIPLLLLGLDVWLRDKKRWGALLAGASVFFAGLLNVHLLFFALLLLPLWLLPNLFAARASQKTSPKDWWLYLRSGWPLLPGLALSFLPLRAHRLSFQGTEAENGFAFSEIARFSAPWSHSFDPAVRGGLRETYIGDGLLLLVGILLALLIFRMSWKGKAKDRAHFAVLIWILVLAGACTIFASGPNNPWGVSFWQEIVRHLPPLAFLREPAIVLLLLPSFIALATALGFSVLPSKLSASFGIAALLLLGPLLLRHLHPRICLLERRNLAYQAAADDLERPHAIALPLWRGDSPWSSIYVAHAKNEHLRLVNGYRVSADTRYVSEVYERFQSFNQGSLSDTQLNDLLQRGIERILFHENAFPEEAGPFASGRCLLALQRHPRLSLLGRDGPVWAFAIRPQTSETTPDATAPPAFASTRFWNLEFGMGNAEPQTDPLSYNGQYQRLSANTRSEILTLNLALTGNEMLWLRARGPGTCDIDLLYGDETWSRDLELGDAGWTWVGFELPARNGPLQALRFRASGVEGSIDLDVLHLTTAQWNPNPEVPVTLPALAFFRSGQSDPETGSVQFLPGRDPAGIVFHGPNLPLRRGRYRAELRFHSEAPADSDIGVFRLKDRPGTSAPLRPGQPSVLHWTHNSNNPWNIEVLTHNNQPLTLLSVTLIPER